MAVRSTPSIDPSACAAAFEREAAFVQSSLRRHGIQAADIDDLAHEILIVMWRRWADYDAARPLRPWLAGIVFKVAHRHRLRRRREVAHAVIEEADPGPSLEEQLEIRRQRALVLRALGGLADGHRAVLVLHEMDGLTLDEVADLLEVPRSTAFSRLRVARDRFAKEVRRLQLREPAGRLLSDPATLLASERAEETPPVEGSDDAVDRTRRILLALPPEPSKPGPLPRAVPWLLAAAALTLATLDMTLPGPRPAPVTAVAGRRAPASSSSLARGLVGHWRFDETAGRLAIDDSGQRNHCYLRRRPTAAAWAPGRTGGAIQLEGDGWLECPPSPSLARPSVELSVAAWVRLPEGRTGVQTLLARQQADDVRDDFFLGVFAHAASGDELVVNSKTWATRVGAPLGPAQGRWIHVAATQARNGATTLFVDGKPVATRWSKRPHVPLQAAKKVVIGGGVNGREPRAVNQLFDGDLDELVVYERALAADEVQALAAGRVP